MKPESEQVQRWEDIIFEKRNKEYGAYAIRKSYNSNVLKAELISIGIGLLIFIIPILMPDDKGVLPVIPESKGDIVLKHFDVKPENLPAERQVARRANASVIPTRVTTAPVADESPVQQNDEVTYTTGPETGTPDSGTENPVESGTGTIPVEVETKPFDIVEIMPTYEGGDQAMVKFLQKKLRYPSRARARGEQGTVYVGFVVSADGSLTNVRVIKGFNKDCEEEAIRVVSMMDKWKPGIQNKIPVPVNKVLPITFRM